MAKYSPKAAEKVARALHEMHEGTLKSSSGQKVTRKKQAIAIGLSEARAAGAKVPEKPDHSPEKSGKSPAKKKAASKTASPKAAKKSAPKKKAASR